MRANDYEVGAPGCGLTDDFFLRIGFDNVAGRAQASAGENCFGLCRCFRQRTSCRLKFVNNTFSQVDCWLLNAEQLDDCSAGPGLRSD